MLRVGAIALVLATLGGCGAPPPPPAPLPPPAWSLILDSAVLDDPGAGVAPQVFVIATVAGNEITSPSVAATPDPAGGFDAVWNTALLSGDATVLGPGIDLQVLADFGAGPEVAGEAMYQPARDDYGNGPIDVGAFGNVANLTLELVTE